MSTLVAGDSRHPSDTGPDPDPTRIRSVYIRRLTHMCPMVNTDDLCDAHEVAALIGLTHPNSVHGYLRRYADMPRPVLALGRNRPQLWLRPEVEAWLRDRTVRRASARTGSGVR